MQQYKPSPLVGLLTVVSVAAGPIWVLLRGAAASRTETLISLSSLFPLGLLAMHVRHREQVRIILAEQNPASGKKEFDRLRQENRRNVIFLLVMGFFYTTLLAWFLFALKT